MESGSKPSQFQIRVNQIYEFSAGSLKDVAAQDTREVIKKALLPQRHKIRSVYP